MVIISIVSLYIKQTKFNDEEKMDMNKPVQPKEPLVTHIYTADPSAHVFEGKIYIYPSHDLDHDGPSNDNGDQYAMEDYHILYGRY